PHTILVEDALTLSLLVAEWNHFCGIVPVRFRIIRCEKRVDLCSSSVLAAAGGTAKSGDTESSHCQVADSHRPAPCSEARAPMLTAVFCGLIPARSVTRQAVSARISSSVKFR